MQFYHTAVVFVGLILVCSCKDLPSYFPRCHKDDPNLNKCLLEATETMRPYISKGVPEVQIPSFNPLKIPKIELEQGTPNLNYKLKLTDIEIREMDKYKFESLNYDSETLSFDGTTKFPVLRLKANYDMDGRFLLLPITGKGVIEMDIEPSSGRVAVKGKLENKKGEDYYVPVEVNVKLDVPGGSIKLNGLFNGNKELEEATNQALNDNSKELIQEITPAVEEVTKGLIRRMMVGLNTNVPYNKLLPLSS